MGRAGSSRERLLDVGAAMFGRQGFHGTGVKQIVTAAHAPFASLYHFFPGGKEDLGAEAVRRAGAAYAAIVMVHFPPGVDVAAATQTAFAEAAAYVSESGYEDACPIATVALEISSTSEPLRLACAEVFEGWIAGLEAVFVADGIPADQARPLAIQWLSLLEGAFIFCRASRSTEALAAAGAAAAALVRAVQRPPRSLAAARASKLRT